MLGLFTYIIAVVIGGGITFVVGEFYVAVRADESKKLLDNIRRRERDLTSLEDLKSRLDRRGYDLSDYISIPGRGKYFDLVLDTVNGAGRAEQQLREVLPNQWRATTLLLEAAKELCALRVSLKSAAQADVSRTRLDECRRAVEEMTKILARQATHIGAAGEQGMQTVKIQDLLDRHAVAIEQQLTAILGAREAVAMMTLSSLDPTAVAQAEVALRHFTEMAASESGFVIPPKLDGDDIQRQLDELPPPEEKYEEDNPEDLPDSPA